jgi:hypothetical protein
MKPIFFPLSIAGPPILQEQVPMPARCLNSISEAEGHRDPPLQYDIFKYVFIITNQINYIIPFNAVLGNQIVQFK